MRQLISVLDQEQLRYYVADDDGELRQIALIMIERSFTPEAVAQLGLNLQAAISPNGARRRAVAVESPRQLAAAQPVEIEHVEQLQTAVEHDTRRRQLEVPRQRGLGKRLDPIVMRRLLDAIEELPPEGLDVQQIGAITNMRDRVLNRLRVIARLYNDDGMSAPFELIARRGNKPALVVPREQRKIRSTAKPIVTRTASDGREHLRRYDWPSDLRIVEYVRAHPDSTMSEIGTALGVEIADTRTSGAWRAYLTTRAARLGITTTRTATHGSPLLLKLNTGRVMSDE